MIYDTDTGVAFYILPAAAFCYLCFFSTYLLASASSSHQFIFQDPMGRTYFAVHTILAVFILFLILISF